MGDEVAVYVRNDRDDAEVGFAPQSVGKRVGAEAAAVRQGMDAGSRHARAGAQDVSSDVEEEEVGVTTDGHR